MLTSKYVDYWILVTLAEKKDAQTSFEIKLHEFDVYRVHLRLQDLYGNLRELLEDNHIYCLKCISDQSEPFGAVTLTELGRQALRNRHRELELVARSILMAGLRFTV